ATVVEGDHESGLGTWTTTWYIFGVGVVLILALQIGTAISVLHASKDMRLDLSQAQESATELERSIGYGGLIHHFKNYVLRPDEEHYRTSAFADAARAQVFLSDLQKIAASLDVESAALTETFAMVGGYTERLNQVMELRANGHTSRYIDEKVRFDNELVLEEVGELIVRLSSAISDEMAQVYRRGMIFSILGTLGTAMVGVLLTIIIVRRQQRYANAITVIAKRLKNSNESLTKANTSLNQFAGIASHELKTPIRAISIYIHMIADDIEDAEVVSQHIDGVRNSIEEVTQIVDSLLEFTKSGFSPPQLAELDVVTLFDQIEKGLELEIDSDSAELTFNAEIDQPILADAEQLSRVLYNLIENGQKFTHKGKRARITIHACSDGDFALISVTDNGIGIDPRCAERIFEPLKSLHGPGSDYEGTGIGLSLVRSIAEGHGGKAWLDTSCLSETRFVISIPLAPEHDEQSVA
ncbi:HAMP domain-containing histidine kinase, partial [Granulosicoccus sp.]|nr:HAMP domain-containing histidine kinase [Granulosicoccus sp.]